MNSSNTFNSTGEDLLSNEVIAKALFGKRYRIYKSTGLLCHHLNQNRSRSISSGSPYTSYFHFFTRSNQSNRSIRITPSP